MYCELPLNRNIANNNFSGMIPQEFSSIPNLMYAPICFTSLSYGNHLYILCWCLVQLYHRVGGNSFVNMPASPLPALTPPKNPRDQPNHPQGPVSAPTVLDTPIDQDDKKLQTGPLVGIAVGSIAVASCVLFTLVFCLYKARKRNDDGSSEPKDIVGSLAVNIDRGKLLVFLCAL